MRIILVYLLFFIGSDLSLFNPVWAACFYTWNNIFRPADFTHSDLGFSPADFVIGCLALSFGIHLIIGNYKLRPNVGTFFILAFLGWASVSTLFAPSGEIALEGLITIFKYLIPLVFISMVFRNLKDIDHFCWSMALSVGVWSAQAGLHGIIKGGGVIDMGIPGAQMSDRNDFIVGVLIALPLLVYMFVYYDGPFRKIIRIFLFLITFLSFVAVPISLSRGGMLGLVIMIFLITLLSRKRIRNMVILLALLPIIYFSLPDFVFERMSTIEVGGEQTESSAQARLGNMQAGIAMATDYPISGVGPLAFLKFIPSYSEEWLEPHSIWIKAAAELGVVGLILYIVLIAFITWRLVLVYQTQFHKNRKLAHLALAFISAFLGFNVAASFSNKLYSEYQWTLIATAGAFAKKAGIGKGGKLMSKKGDTKHKPIPDSTGSAFNSDRNEA